MTFAEAMVIVDAAGGGLLSIRHLLYNDDGTFSVMRHINCEWCDYCMFSEREYERLITLGKTPEQASESVRRTAWSAQEDPYTFQH